jgi:hypothetical protein
MPFCGVEELLDRAHVDQLVLAQCAVDVLRQQVVLGCVGAVPVVEGDVKAVQVALAPGGDAGHELLRRLAGFSAAIMMGAPWVSSAQTKFTSCPSMRCSRTQVSAWMYSIMWPT